MLQHMQHPGGQYEPTYFHTVQRFQLQYHPKSGTEINSERLPPYDTIRDMQLAYREQQYSDYAIEQYMHGKMLTILAGTLAAVLGLVLVGPVIPLWQALSAAGGVTFLANLFFAYRRQFTIMRMLKAFLMPLIAVLLAVGFSALLTSRTLATGAIALMTLYLVRRFGGELFEFYRDWLYTHPRLRPETRAAPRKIKTRPSLRFLLGIFIIAIGGPWVSITLTMLVIMAWSAWRCGRGGAGKAVILSARRPLAQFLTYGSTSTGAPGVWLPRTTLLARQTHMLLVVGAVYLTLTVGLCVFFPWDLIRGQLFQLQFGQPAAGSGGWNDPQLWAFHRYLADRPHGWLTISVWSIFQNPLVVWSYPIGFAIASVLPNLVLIAAYRDPIVQAERLRREIDGVPGDASIVPLDEDGDRTEWQWYVDRVRSSPHTATDPMGKTVREAEHLFLGVEPKAQFPVLLDRSILAEHAYIVGQSGSGKTSLAIMPLILQLLRGSANPGGSVGPPPPMVILDLKGDPALFFTIKAEVEARRAAMGIDDSAPEGRANPLGAFRFFTPEAGKASHYFNPFLSLQGGARTPLQVCQLLLESLSLNHGEGYGRSYYSRRSRMLMFQALGHASNPRSFDDLYKVLNTDEFRKEGNESLELLSVIEALTQYPQLSATRELARPEQAIHMPSVLEYGQVVYFWLPAAVESVSVREMGKLGLFSLLSAAIERQRSGLEHRQAYLVIDEFQRIAGDNFRIILEQARSFGIGAILANQTQSDLKTADTDLRATVSTNTRFKQYFSVSDPNELQELVLLSGQELCLNKSWGTSTTSQATGSSYGTSSNWGEGLKPRLTVNDLLRISDHPLDSVVLVSRGAGYTQFGGVPIPMRSTWPISPFLYKARQREPWPAVDKYDERAVVTGRRAPAAIDQDRDRKLAAAIFDKLEAFAESKKPRLRTALEPAIEATGTSSPAPPVEGTEPGGHA